MSGGSLDDKVPPTDSLSMKEALDAVGVPNERHIVSGKCHALGCFDNDPSLWPSAVQFLHTYLPAGAGPSREYAAPPTPLAASLDVYGSGTFERSGELFRP
jgi:hypothetical protein